MVKEWRRDKYRTTLTGEALFVTCERDCYEITSQAANIVDELSSTQEEADTRLIVHVSHAARSGYKAVVVASEVTDLFLLCQAFKHFIPASLYVKCGTQTRTRYVSISDVVPAVGGELSKCLIGMHAFTGCDTECLHWKRKNNSPTTCQAAHILPKWFKQLGMEWLMGSIRYAFSEPPMSRGTGCSAPGRVTSTPPSYHLVLTACSSMGLAQTSKHPFGSEVCKAAEGLRPQLVLAGAKTVIILPLTG